MIHDKHFKKLIDDNPNMMVPWWIMAAWAYEVASSPILSDAAFDQLAKDLDECWDLVEHRHKKLLDRKLLKSSLAIREKWPGIAIGAAKSLIKMPQSPKLPKVK